MTPSHENKPDPTETAQRRAARNAMRRCWMITAGAVALTGLGLASCVPSQREPAPVPPAPTPAPAPAPTIVVPTEWRDAPITPGGWTYRADGNATRALFGPAGSEAQFTVACEPGNRQIRLWRAGSAAGPTTMTITTTSETKVLAAQPSGTQIPQIVATLAPHDPIIDAMIFSRGRFAVAAPGTQPIYLPNWAEIARVAEDCR